MKRRTRSRLKKPRKKAPAKSIFKSKTAAANFIVAVAGTVAAFEPATADFVKSHSAAILAGIGFANMALRMVSHDRVTLFGRARAH
jgi:hypothetical protein